MPNGQYPAVLAGQVYTAALIQGFAPPVAWKAADTSLTSNVTLTADPDLTLPVAANAWYEFRCFLSYTGAAQGTGDLQWQWTAPSGAVMNYTAWMYPTSGGFTANVNLAAVGASSAIRTAGSNGATTMPVVMEGTLVMSSTAGSLQLKWAQNTSSTTATVVKASSRMSLRRIV